MTASTPIPPARPRPNPVQHGGGFFVRFGRDKRAATALEFALVAPPFFLVCLGILELALIFIVSVNLSNTTATLGRQIRVGSIVAPGISTGASNGAQISLQDFKSKYFCPHMWLMPQSVCLNQLQIDVRTLNSFQSSPPVSPISGQTFDATSFCYYSGGPGSVVEIRAYYLWPLLTPLLLAPLANVTTLKTSATSGTGSWQAIGATAVFINEPSPTLSNSGTGPC